MNKVCACNHMPAITITPQPQRHNHKVDTMALLKKLTPGTTAAAAAPAAPRQITITLPTEVNDPPETLDKYSILLYGEKKIGKTSMAGKFPDALFLATEPGTKALRVYSMPVTTYATFVDAITLLESDTKFKTVVIDTVDLCYEMVFAEVCRKKGIKHPSDEDDFGATWDDIKKEFSRLINRLLNIPGKGLILLSHDIEREIQLRDGGKCQRVQPTMAKGAMACVEALVDVMVNYYYEDGQRWLRIDGSERVQAGCRLEERFIRKGGTPNTAGDRIKVISGGRTSQESYDNFIAAFNNQQVDPDPSSEPRKSAALKKAKAE